MFYKALRKSKLDITLSEILFAASLVSLLWWLSGRVLFYSDHSPGLSPFTSLSLLGMTGVQLAASRVPTWGKPMSLAILGIVSCGNASSLLMLLLVPSLVLETIPWIVPTSVMTSCGLILFCLYEILVLIRATPRSFFIVDDILLHLALFPGGLSLVGPLMGKPTYLSSSVDPRVGVGILEMAFMATFAVSAVLSNRDLFLWRFLGENHLNKFVFGILFLNQYVAPTFVGLFFVHASTAAALGPEFFVMLAGVLATLLFLSVQAFLRYQK